MNNGSIGEAGEAAGLASGLRVVELAGDNPGPAYAGKLLAHMGADVVCVEPPEGSPLRQVGPFANGEPNREKSGLFFALNLNKRGVTLALNTPTGLDCLRALLRTADVLIFSLDPSRTAALQLDAQSLADAFPALVTACITPYGSEGPWSDWKGGDLQASAAGGASIGIGRPDREPLGLLTGPATLQGGLAAVAGVFASLLGRQADGLGDWVDVSASDVWATIHANFILTYLYRGVTGIRTGNHGGALYPDTVLPCKDGQVVIVCNQLQQWIRLLELMGNPDWVQNPRYRDRRRMTEEYPDEVDALLIPWLNQYTREELWAMCRQAHVPLAPVYRVDELLSQPQLLFRKYFVDIASDAFGALRLPGLPYELTNTVEFVARPAPRLGEHNIEILEGELGLPREDIVQMRRAGVI